MVVDDVLVVVTELVVVDGPVEVVVVRCEVVVDDAVVSVVLVVELVVVVPENSPPMEVVADESR